MTPEHYAHPPPLAQGHASGPQEAHLVEIVLAMVIFAVYLAHVRVYDDASAAPQGGITPLVVDFVYRRRAAEVILDVCLITLAYYAAYRLRFEDATFIAYFPGFLKSLPLVVGLVAAVMAGEIVSGLMRRMFQ